MNSISTNPLLLPENLSLYGLDIWKAVNETKPSEKPQHNDSGIIQRVRKYSQTVAFCNSKMESLEKVIKNSHRTIDILTTLEEMTDGMLIKVSASFKSSIEFLESIRFIGALKTLLVPQKNRKYFLFDPENSVPKKCDRVLLAAHNGCKTVRSLNKWKLIDLGKIARVKIGGQLTAFHFVTDGLMIGSSLFGLWDTSFKCKNVLEKDRRLVEKKNKWTNRPLSLGLLLIEDQEEVARFKKKYESKIEKLSAHIALKQRDWELASGNKEVSAAHSKTQQIAHEKLQTDLELLQKKLGKNKERLEKINTSDFQSLVIELFSKDLNSKLEPIEKSIKENDVQYHLQILKIASSASKILVIAAALWMTAINVWTTIPLVMLLSLGFVADSLGLVKIFAEKSPAAQ